MGHSDCKVPTKILSYCYFTSIIYVTVCSSSKGQKKKVRTAKVNMLRWMLITIKDIIRDDCIHQDIGETSIVENMTIG